MKKILCILFLILFSLFFLTSCRAYKENAYDWDRDVEEYVNLNYPNADIKITKAGKDNDEVIYNCETNDERNLEFKITCKFVDQVDFFIITRNKNITDNFGDAIDSYISARIGKYNISSKSVDEIADYIKNTMDETVSIYKEYGFTFITPNIEYILYEKDNIHVFKNGSRDRDIIYKKVFELLDDRKE